MKIETYEVEEITGELGVMAADSEAIELCEKLGLKGQLKLTNKETGTRQPYRRMTALELLVFSQVCPQRTPLENYDAGIIPLRVLQVASHAKEFFSHLTVWHPNDIRRDPVLVGTPGPYSSEYHLLARWAEAWQDFETLTRQAKESWKIQYRAELTDIMNKAKQRLESVNLAADEAFIHGNAPAPYFSLD